MNREEKSNILKEYLNGVNSPKGEEVFNEWFSNNENNLIDEDEVESSLKNVRKKLINNINKAKIKDYKKIPLNSFLNNYKYIAAAVIFILLAGGAFIFYLKPFSSKTTLIEVTNFSHQPMEVKLVDGSVITLNFHSAIIYPKYFDKEKRNVYLKGEAYFKVFKNKVKPFFINTSNTEIKVLGTSFNVKQNDSSVTVAVIEGKVAFKDKNDKSIEFLTAGTAAKIYINHSHKSKYPVSSENYKSWINGWLVFDETPLNEVVSQLSEFYDIPIIIKGDQLKRIRVTADMKRATLDEVLNNLKGSISNVTFNKTDKLVIITSH